jgi:transcriptional regulator CtsR
MDIWQMLDKIIEKMDEEDLRDLIYRLIDDNIIGEREAYKIVFDYLEEDIKKLIKNKG